MGFDVGFVQFCFLRGFIFFRRRWFIGDFTTVGHTVSGIVHDVIVPGTDVVRVNDTVEIGVIATVRYSVVVEVIGVVKTLADVIVVRNTVAVFIFFDVWDIVTVRVYHGMVVGTIINGVLHSIVVVVLIASIPCPVSIEVKLPRVGGVGTNIVVIRNVVTITVIIACITYTVLVQIQLLRV